MIKKTDLIIVLYGGNNVESEVSKVTGKNMLSSLINMGYNAQKLFFDDNFINNIQKLQPKLVCNALHGKFGEDGRIQSILDFMKIPYTHSNSTASAIAMNKILTSIICTTQIENLYDPKTVLIYKNNIIEAQKIINNFPKPFILKPIYEGSSAGVRIIKDDLDIKNYNWEFDDKMIIQEHIKGAELQIAIMDNKSLGICEIIPEGEFFDYNSKYGGKTEYIIPARISKDKYEEILDISLKCHQLINCEGINRIELILSEDEKIYFLEMNTQPGLTKTSLIPKIAKEVNISFDQIIEYLINSAQFNT